MAVGAEQAALRRLSPHRGERSRQPSHTELERLLGGIQVVELERAHIAVVAAQRTATTSFLNEYLLDPPPPVRDSVDAAFRAAGSMTVSDEQDWAVPDTDALAALLARGASGSATERFKPVLLEPIANGRIRLPRRRSNLADRHACVCRLLKLGPIHSAILLLEADGLTNACSRVCSPGTVLPSPRQSLGALVLVAAQAVRVLRELQLRKRAGLDLAYSLARHADLGADVLQGHRAGWGEAVAQLEHAALAPRERLECLLERGLAELVRDDLERAAFLLVLDEVAQARIAIAIGADRSLQRDGLLAELQDVLDLAGRHLDLRRDLFDRGLAPQRLGQIASDARDAVHPLDHVHRDADRAGLVGKRASDRLPDPPGRVRRKLEASAPVELLDCADQAEVALLDQVQERQPAAGVALGDRNHEAQVRLDQVVLRRHVVLLDALGEANLVVLRQQRHAADRLEVQTDGVLGACFLRGIGLDARRRNAALVELVVAVAGDERNRCELCALGAVGVGLFDLFLRDALRLFLYGFH